ncbi:MAG: ABC transporter permease [Gemmatimonadota bacterium]|nr:MAG: ABC transporter permease [Gemmatimonadota bacterium]
MPTSGPSPFLRRLFGFFPRNHREAFGAEMWEVVRYRHGQRGRGVWAGWKFNAVTAMDIVWSALQMRGTGMGRWMMSGWRGFGMDARFTLRGLGRAPAFTLTALVVIAVAVGVNTAVFAFVTGTLLERPPYESPDELVMVWASNPGNGQIRDVISGSNFVDLLEHTTTLSSLAALHGDEVVMMQDGRPVVLPAFEVTVDFLSVLGVEPAVGRDFQAEDRVSGGGATALISYGFWQDGFGGDPGVIGSSLELDGEPTTIIGVLPEDFRFAGAVPVYVPLHEDDLAAESRTHHHYNMIGRLQPGTTPADVTREMSGILAGITSQYPQLTGWSVLAEPMTEVTVEAVRATLWLIAASALLVFAVVIVNLGTLFRIRTLERMGEISIRTALGAPRRRIAAIILAEAIGLSALGGALGLFLAPAVLRLLSAIAPPVVLIPNSAAAIPVLRATLEPTVQLLVFAGALAAGALLAAPSLITALAPTSGISASRGSSRVTSGIRSKWLVGVEVALAMVLSVGAALTVRSANHLASQDMGVVGEGVLTTYFGDVEDLPTAQRAEYFRQVIIAVEALPGVERVGTNDYRPFEGEDDFQGVRFPERPTPEPGRGPREEWRRVSEGLFDAAGMRITRGRGFRPVDFEATPNAVVVNEAFAAKHYPGQDPVGRRLTVTEDGYRDVEIVGVVADVLSRGPAVAAPPVLYAPYQAAPRGHVSLFVKVSGDPMSYGPAVREAIWSVDSRQPVLSMIPLEEVVRRSMAVQTMMSRVVGAMASATLILAALGVFGVVGFMVRSRTRELGVRLVLGATSGQLERGVVAGMLPILGVSVFVGLFLSVVTSRALRSILFGVSPVDPIAFGSATLIVAVMVLLATYLPARSVSKVDPARVIEPA